MIIMLILSRLELYSRGELNIFMCATVTSGGKLSFWVCVARILGRLQLPSTWSMELL